VIETRYCTVHGVMTHTTAGPRCYQCDPFVPDLEPVDESQRDKYPVKDAGEMNMTLHSPRAKIVAEEEKGVKFDTGKPAFALIPPYIEEEVAKVLAYGAKKYAPDNWKKVPGAKHRYFDAHRRHMNAHKRGELRDPETGLLHIAHAIASLMFMGEFELTGLPEIPDGN